MRKEFMGKASKLTNVSFNAITAAVYIINKIQEDLQHNNAKIWEISKAESDSVSGTSETTSNDAKKFREGRPRNLEK